MSKFFEDFGERVAQTAGTLTDKAEDIVEITRIKNLIRNLKHENQKDIRKLGEFVYGQYKDKERLPQRFTELCEEIEGREKSIERYREQVSGIKGEHICPSCGKYSPKTTLFCPYCGNRLADEGTGARDKGADLKEKAEVFAEKAKEKAEDFAEKFKEKAGDFADKAEDFRQKAKEKAEDFAEKAKEKAGDFADKAEDFAEKAKDKAEDFAEKAKDRAEDFAEKAKDKAEDFVEKAKDKVKGKDGDDGKDNKESGV